MASQKDKYIASAQKFLLKGQVDKAIKDYEEVVAFDPADIRNRQKLAELYVKAGRKEDAVKEYEKIGKSYDDKGFFLKAIAVYKQIQKLDPTNLDIYLVLGDLNHKQGLIGNALAEYKILVDYYEKKNQLNEAIKVIEKMLAVDPENLNILLKLAETFFGRGLEESSYQYYTKVALTLKKRGEEKLFSQICARIRDHFPTKTDFFVDMAAEQFRSGDTAGAIVRVSEILECSPGNVAALKLLVEVYPQTGETEKLRSACEQLLRVSPGELSAMQKLVESYVEAGDVENALQRLHRFKKDFVDAGLVLELAAYFRRLQGYAPDNIPLLEEVREVYELSGDTTGRDLIAGQIERLRQESMEALSTEPEEQEPEARQEDLAPPPESALPEMPAEQEIELELPEGPIDFEVEAEHPVVIEQPPQPAAQQEETPPLHEEIELVLDIPEEDALVTEPVEEMIELDLSLDAEPPFSFDEKQLEGEGLAPDKEDESSVSLEPLEFENVFEGPDFELELEGAFTAEAEQPAQETEQLPGKASKYTVAGVISEFRKGIDRQVAKEDTETHYNLGIAYMEMGLYDDAVREFKNGARDPQRKIDCQTLTAVCFRDKGDFQSAEQTLREGLAMAGLGREEILSLTYELALVYESSGDTDSALRELQEVAAIAPNFRDTREKIEELLGIGGLDEEEGELELIDLDQEEDN
ncbi:MAG: tetratricopeptide repeat protein [Geobacter sp.]|nr:tetratricopeptide repeat protein [Geobacter sp.]